MQASTNRRRFMRRAIWLLLAIVAVSAAWIALDEAVNRDVFDRDVLRIGQWVAVILIVLLLLRIIFNVYRWLITKNETIQLLDRGFRWQKGKHLHKYSWAHIKTYRDTTRKGLFARGGLIFTMRDNETFKLTRQHGDLNALKTALEPIIADITGTVIGRALRNKKRVKLHPSLIISAGGVIAGDAKIRWSQVDIVVKKNKLRVSKLGKSSKFKVVRTYPVGKIDNLPGFLDIAESVIRNHQPKRFNIKTYGAG